MSRVLLFHRDYQCYSGGHGKVWNYFQHADAHPGWSSRMHLADASVDEGNPWRAVPAQVCAEWRPAQADALLLGGTDWEIYPRDDPARPVINLVQGVRHADPELPLRAFLSRRAIRICVSDAVADAILATGEVNGPVRVIAAALDLPRMPAPTSTRHGVFIDALKQPALGAALQAALQAQGREVVLSTMRLPRGIYLQRLADAAIAVLLPHEQEGFYLPGLEAMALGCATIVPDCLGNRAYLRLDGNALAPALRLEELVQAVARLDDPSLARGLAATGRQAALQFGLAQERRAFHGVLDELDALWRQ